MCHKLLTQRALFLLESMQKTLKGMLSQHFVTRRTSSGGDACSRVITAISNFRYAT